MIQKKLLLVFALLSFYNSSFAQIPAAGNVLWLKADAAVYTDAGVTPATNGQAVQQWNDQSGGNKHAAQATLAMRPTFITNSINSLPALHFTSSMLVTPNIDFSTTDKSDVYIIYKSSTPNPAGQCILELSPDINTNQSFDLFENLTGVTYTGFWTGVSGNVGLNAQTYPVKADVFKIVNSTYDKSIAGGSETFLRINGKDMTLASGYAYNNNTNNYSNQPIYIGNRGASLAYALNGDIAEIIIYDTMAWPGKMQT